MIESGPIFLRAIERSDLAHLQAWRNIESFRQNFREFRELSIDHQNVWYESVQSRDSNHHMFAVCDAKTEEIIGAAGLCYIHWTYRNADLSFYIGKDLLYADDVYGRHAVLGLLKYGFYQLNLNRIWCELYETDGMKEWLLNSLGFKREGILRETAFKNGRYINSHIWAILSREVSFK